jgi:hypothetical protein
MLWILPTQEKKPGMRPVSIGMSTTVQSINLQPFGSSAAKIRT